MPEQNDPRPDRWGQGEADYGRACVDTQATLNAQYPDLSFAGSLYMGYRGRGNIIVTPDMVRYGGTTLLHIGDMVRATAFALGRPL